MMSQQGGSLKNAGGDQNPNTSLDGGMKTQPDTMKMGTQQDVDDGPRRVQQRFQSLSLRDYYDTSALTVILSKGLEELARQRPSNPVKFLAQYLIENDPDGAM